MIFQHQDPPLKILTVYLQVIYLIKLDLKDSEWGCWFSEKHANFTVNYGHGSYDQLKKLLETAEKLVGEYFGIKLEKEIRIVE